MTFNQQQPSSRPWFRLASQIRFEQPPPVPAPSQLQPPTPPQPTAPSPPRPKFGRLQSFLPVNPPTTESSQPPPVAPPTPQPPAPVPAASRAAVTPPMSPKVIKPSEPTPPPSPRIDAPPPSLPLARRLDYTPPPTPPPPQANRELEPRLPMAEKRSAAPAPLASPPIFERKNTPPLPSPKMETKSPPRRFEEAYANKREEDKTTVVESTSVVKPNSTKKKKPSPSEAPAVGAFGMLTLAGDNVGAHMELGGQNRRSIKPNPKPFFTGQSYHLKEESKDAGERSNGASKSQGMENKAGVETTVPMAALVNSNVQGANNSILFNSTCVHGSPGVHIVLSSSSSLSKHRRNAVHTPRASSQAPAHRASD